jgi:hypothetical protein
MRFYDTPLPSTSSEKKLTPKEIYAQIRSHYFYEWRRKERVRKIGWGGFLKRRIVSTSVSPSLEIYSVTFANIKSKSFSLPISIKRAEKKTVEEFALINSGARGVFMD